MGDGGAVGKGKDSKSNHKSWSHEQFAKSRNFQQDDDLDNAYELLGLEDDAGEKEIKALIRPSSKHSMPHGVSRVSN